MNSVKDESYRETRETTKRLSKTIQKWQYGRKLNG